VNRLRYSLTSLGVQPDTVTRSAVISTNTFVAFDLSKVSLLWLGLASHCHLQQHGGNRLAPIWILAPQVVESDKARLDIKLTPMAKGSPFPRSIEFFDGKMLPVGTDKGLEWIDYPIPYNQGFLRAHYEVTAEAPFAGRPFPKEFSLTVYDIPLDAYDPKQTRLTKDLFVGWSFQGAVNRIEGLSSPGDLRPQIAGAMGVIDLRQSDKDTPVFEYVTSNWRDDGDEEVAAAAARHHQMFNSVPNQVSQRSGAFVLVTMIILTSGFLFAALWRNHLNKTRA
jgi:hypothetical protein